MKSQVVALVILAGAASGISAPFQNLGFDEANTNQFIVDSYGLVSDLLPGWQLSNGIPGPNLVGYDVITIGLNYASLYDTRLPAFGDPLPVQGKYALGLWPGTADNGAFAAYHLSQMGDVPVDAKTIRFASFGGPFDLRVNDQLLPLVYDYPPDYDRIILNGVIPVPAVGDISAFAGRTIELEFITLPAVRGPNEFLHGIDGISFSPEVIPEPSTWALFGLGALGFFLTRVGRRIQKSCVWLSR